MNSQKYGNLTPPFLPGTLLKVTPARKDSSVLWGGPDGTFVLVVGWEQDDTGNRSPNSIWWRLKGLVGETQKTFAGTYWWFIQNFTEVSDASSP